MVDHDELAQLGAERDRLRSMIDYHQRSALRLSLAPSVRLVLIGMACGFGALIVAGVLADQITPSFMIFWVVFLALPAYILTRKINVFGTGMQVREILNVVSTPGEPEARQLLADCEARILHLKKGRP